MSLSRGTKLDTFEVIDLVGEGGMGEVYRARDTRLGREVAIKVLPPAFSSDGERVARFRREAQLLATLNHSNIAILYDFRSSDDTSFLVMELVEGQTLAEKIEAGPMSVREAIPVFRQIADAVDTAHEKGIIHRDLKPANIKITEDGHVKILDFGIAKGNPIEGEEPADGPTPTPTPDATTLPATPPHMAAVTAEGLLIGTPSYMSPDQARGRPVDKRADIWAFGVCLYQTLTGKLPFEGETISDTLSSVLRDEVDWDALPKDIPPRLRELLGRCLEKKAKSRLRDMGDAVYELSKASDSSDSDSQAPEASRDVIRYEIRLPEGMRLSTIPPSIDVSNDGKMLLFNVVENGVRKIYVRAIDELELRMIPGTEGAFAPFFSWDGQWITFFLGRNLSKVPVRGGAVQTITQLSTRGLGAFWIQKNLVVFSQSNSGLKTVSPNGGPVTTITELDPGRSELHHSVTSRSAHENWLFGVVYEGSEDRPVMEAISLESGERRRLRDTGTVPSYVPTGHLMWSEGNRLFASLCDGIPPKLSGPAVQILSDVGTDFYGRACLYSYSSTGTFMYTKGRPQSTSNRVFWVTRDGEREEIPMPENGYINPRISPDGELMLLNGKDRSGHFQIFLHEFHRGVTEMVTRGDTRNNGSAWMPDGNSFAYMSDINGTEGILTMDLSDQRSTVVQEPEVTELAHSITRDGQYLAYIKFCSDARQEIWIRRTDGDAEEFVSGPNRNTAPMFDPTGQYVTYVSDESRRWEVYVKPFGVPGRRMQISVEGGISPVWSPDGSELFYMKEGGHMMRVPIEREPRFRAGKPQKLFDIPRANITTAHTSLFDIHPDGDRFLMTDMSNEDQGATEVVVVLNWFEELKRLVPTKP